MIIGQRISFRYKNKKNIKGTIVGVVDNQLFLKLETNYLGKNVDWFIGEEKEFNISEMKKIANI